MKKVAVMILLFTVAFSAVFVNGAVHPVEASTPIEVIIDGQVFRPNVSPITEQSRVLVPMRSIFEALGATVEWENTTRTVTGTKEDTVVVLQIDNKEARMNNEIVMLDVAPKIVSNSTMIPLRFIATALGAEIDWNGQLQSVTIVTNEDTALKHPKVAWEHGSTPANVYDVGNEVQKDGWLYFVDTNGRDASGLYKMRPDGTELTKLSNLMGQHINVYKDHMYFVSGSAKLHSVRTDGMNEQNLKHRVEFPHLVDNWMYYSNLNDKYRLYKLNLDTKQNTPLTTEGVHNLSVAGEWAYYTVDNSIYKIKTSGKSKIRIIEEKYEIDHLILDSSGENLFYSMANYGQGGMWKISTDGKSKQQLSSQMVGGINEIGDWIYFAEYSATDYSNHAFYRMKKDGSSKEHLVDGRVAGIVITGGWVYYNWLEEDSFGNWTRYKMKLDGTDNQIFLVPEQ